MFGVVARTVRRGIGTLDGVLLKACCRQDKVLIAYHGFSVTVVHRLGMHAVAWSKLRHCVELTQFVLHHSCQGSIAALHGVIGRSQCPLSRGAVGHHQNLLELRNVSAHISRGVVDDVVIPTTRREWRALNIYMADLTVVDHRDQTHAVQVLVGTVHPEVTLQGVHTLSKE